jgi:hypothetical protein
MLFLESIKVLSAFLILGSSGKKLCNVIKVLRGIGIILRNAGKNLIEPLTKKSLKAMSSGKEGGQE